MQAAGADVFGFFIHLPGDFGQTANALIAKFQRHFIRGQQRLILPHQAGVGLRKDAFKIFHAEAVEFHADGKAPLQLRHQIAGFGKMKRAAGNEQDVVGAHHAVAGVDGGAFNQRQQIALHALTGNIRALHAGAGGNFVDFVQKDDAVLFDGGHGVGFHVFIVNQAVGFFVRQRLERIGNAHPAAAGFAAAGHVLKHALNLLREFFHARRPENFGSHAGQTDFHVNLFVVQVAFAQFFAELLPRAGFRSTFVAARGRQQNIEHAVFGGIHGAVAHLLARTVATILYRHFHQVADDGVHIAPNIADFSEFGRFHLDEGGIGQTRQTAGDFGFAHTGGANHEDVFRRDFGAQCLFHLCAPPAVAQCDGHRAFGTVLADNVAVEFGDDFFGGHLRHGCSTSTVWFWLV